MPKKNFKNTKKRIYSQPTKTSNSSNGGSSLGSQILGNVVSGATFGVGSSLGHRAIDSVMSSENKSHNNNSIVTSEIPCEKLFDMYNECLNNPDNNCNFLIELITKKCNI